MPDNINEILVTVTVVLGVAAVALRALLRVNRVEILKRFMDWALSWVDVLLSALVIALVIRAFVVEPFKIPSSSMEDTLLIGDHLFVNRFLYGIKIPVLDRHVLPLRAPRRGDIVVFIPPHQPDKDFIKRVIGIPGDTVEIVNQELFVNGVRQVEPYVVHKDAGPWRRFAAPRDQMRKLTVPPGKYFMMGDNRDRSEDSRWWGFADFNQMKGNAFLIYFSWDPNPEVPMWDLLHKVRWRRLLNVIR